MSTIIISILLFIIIGILCTSYFIDKLNNFGHLPKKYFGDTLKYHDHQLTQEGFRLLGRRRHREWLDI